MRPHRVRMTTTLVKGYGLDDKMQLIRPRMRTFEQLNEFHADGARENLFLTKLFCFHPAFSFTWRDH